MSDLASAVTVEGSRVTVAPGPALREFVREEIFFEYDGRDLSALPEHVALLPFVWAVAPVMWATGARAEVAALDAQVYESMGAIRDLMRATYPGLPWTGEVTPRHLVSVEPATERRQFEAALLYSGGVDSTFSALRHAGPRLLLITAWGTDIPLGQEERWKTYHATAEAFAAHHAGAIQVVRTNLREAMDRRRLNALVPDISRWWIEVGFGTSLTGLAAPVAALEGIPRVHFAGLTDFGPTEIVANGSYPRLDNAIALAGARVHHDGSEMTRQQKIEWIAERDEQMPLRVCHADPGVALNCGRCLKCLRTIVGLVLAEADPRRYGFPDYSPEQLHVLPAKFAAGGYTFGRFDARLWTELQERARQGSSADPAFVRWLTGFNFEAYGREARVSAIRSRAVARRLMAAAPWLVPAIKRSAGARAVRRWLP